MPLAPAMKLLVTGAAGFIGYFTSQRLLARGDEVIGLDNLNDYYDVNLKRARLAQLDTQRGFSFVKLDLANQAGVAQLFAREKFQRVVHLGAQAGVRHSLKDPHSYISSNVQGTLNVLEGCRLHRVEHLVYASSSAVYGASTKLPSSVHDGASHPLSLYAASKRSTELMAHSYAAVYGLPTTGLRFFTVYGPWGRPDMALFRFARAIVDGKPIEIYNQGHHQRDFTYVDDIVEGLVRIVDKIAAPEDRWNSLAPDPAWSFAPYRLYNIGSHRPIELLRYIELLEASLGRKAERILRPLQPGDVTNTFADISELADAIGYRPETPIEVGVRRFVDWFRDYYRISS